MLQVAPKGPPIFLVRPKLKPRVRSQIKYLFQDHLFQLHSAQRLALKVELEAGRNLWVRLDIAPPEVSAARDGNTNRALWRKVWDYVAARFFFFFFVERTIRDQNKRRLRLYQAPRKSLSNSSTRFAVLHASLTAPCTAVRTRLLSEQLGVLRVAGAAI